ncbi:MAG: hypothetical protein ABIS50_15380 [Luteolibacter sp.]|uniref:hypothetical protein n=1 Tax=Luteolibacter sp. TaxID=1962973 RepID=UPI003267EC88
MTHSAKPFDHPRIKVVGSFHELLTTPFANGVNALCWPRVLTGNFAEVVELLGTGEGIVSLDEKLLRNLPLSEAGRLAVEVMLEDQRLLREQDLDPEINCIHGYPREETPGPVATDVMSFHVDSATAEADTWLCTYHGAPSEGLPNEEACMRTEIPETRAELQRLYGGRDDEDFRDYLAENCYDLHYAPLPHAKPYSFGVGNLWRIATDWPGSPVPPCIHRAPETRSGDAVRLLLIS